MDFLENKDSNGWKIIPPSWKGNVDESLLKVLSLNRNFIKDIEEQVITFSESSSEDLSNSVVSSWHYHNKFFKSLSGYLELLPERKNLTNKQEDFLESILEDVNLVDRITLLNSLSIKPHLERNINVEVSPFNSFYIDYPLDHHLFHSGELELEEIIKKYHANSTELFEERKNKGILSNIFKSESNKKEIEELNSLRKKMFHKAFYDSFIGKSKKNKSLVELSTLDNFDEYKYLYCLEGIEGFFLKDYLFEKKSLEDSNKGIEKLLNYLTSLNKMENLSKNSPKIPYEVPSYSQMNVESCASTCAMVVSNLFFKEEISEEREAKLHSIMKSDNLPGCPFSKVAYFMSELYEPLEMELIHTNPNLFNDIDVKDILQMKGMRALKEYRHFTKKAKEKGVEIKIVKEIGDYIEETLKRGGIYMAATELSGGALHSELVFGKDPENYHVYDPLKGGKSYISENDFFRKMSTIIGTWGLSFFPPNPKESNDYKKSIEWFKNKEEELDSKEIKLIKYGEKTNGKKS